MADIDNAAFEGDLRVWLRRSPQPVTVRVDTPQGEKNLSCEVGSNRDRWARLEETIVRMKATRVEALDRKGQVLRFVELAHEEEERDAEVPTRNSEPQRMGRYERELATTARLIGQAYKDGAAAVTGQHEQVFAKLLAIVESQAASITNFHNAVTLLHENRLRLAMQDEEDRARRDAEREDEPNGGLESLLPMFAGGLAQGQAAAVAAKVATTNGKKE